MMSFLVQPQYTGIRDIYVPWLQISQRDLENKTALRNQLYFAVEYEHILVGSKRWSLRKDYTPHSNGYMITN